MCKKILQFAAQGISLSMCYIKLGISDVTALRWKKKYSIWNSTIKVAKEICEAVWVEIARINLYNKEFNNVLWMMNMSNRFGWLHSSSKIDAKIDNTERKIIDINYKEDNNEKLAEVARILQQIDAFPAEQN